ncbi:isopentenyl diphosphate isomerase/L-lactate dehydrogenase-like FMN-dependent dehydrogenase [Neorhizobium galegae]|nr:isopentenyl diphosphate isomerase/L-lactate dehydrogenase-like FMN-dependent dehydrogenase [Neorhizobium galegae]
MDITAPIRSQVVARTGISLAKGIEPRAFPRFALDALLHPRWMLEFAVRGGQPMLESWAPHAPEGSTPAQVARFFSVSSFAGQTWQDLETLRKAWPGNLVVKGLVRAEDAERAIEFGADAVTISNHGANKLDNMSAAIDSLMDVKSRLRSDCLVFFDGGIRRGSDILAAYASGAAFCFTGRAFLYGVAAGGRRGVEKAYPILQDELLYAMAMSGCHTPAAATADLLLHNDRPCSRSTALDHE